MCLLLRHPQECYCRYKRYRYCGLVPQHDANVEEAVKVELVGQYPAESCAGALV
jgi:hypothetical protein